MSYTEFLRTKMAAQHKVAAVRKPTDASVYIQRQRMAASSVFFRNGTSVGTLVKHTDRPVNNNAAVSSKKGSGTVPSASDYISHRGSNGSRYDQNDQKYGPYRKDLLCSKQKPSPDNWKYPTASSNTMAKASCPSEAGLPPSDVKFVDNTISLSAMHPQKAIGCDENNTLEKPNHVPSPGIQNINRQTHAVGKHFFMRKPPSSQGPNTSPLKVGSYYTPLSGYVENKRGYVMNTPPVPKAPGPQGQEISHLKINMPTTFPIKV